MALTDKEGVIPNSPILKKRLTFVGSPEQSRGSLADILPDKVLDAIVGHLGHSGETVGVGAFDSEIVRNMVSRKKKY